MDNRPIVAAVQLVLIFPAALFLAAVVARHATPLQGELAAGAQRIVTWYSLRYWTLLVLLIGLPLAALLTGCISLLPRVNRGAGRVQAGSPPAAGIGWRLSSTRVIAAATLAAAAILVVVILHMLAN